MFESLILLIKELVISAGPLGIFVGMFLESSVVPIPSEIVLVGAGAIGFPAWEVAIFGGLGSTVGAIVGYFIGSIGGRPFIKKYGKYFFINEKKMKMVDDWFDTWGQHATLISRLVPLIPFKVFSITAGIAKMDIKKFAVFTLIGTIPRAFMLAYFGNMFSEKNIPLMIILLAIFIASALVVREIGKRKK
jgi:membrane protein DedA with SNARE-associated domain